jgi:hypothetical protein
MEMLIAVGLVLLTLTSMLVGYIVGYENGYAKSKREWHRSFIENGWKVRR